nr:putative RNA-dependent RNA polymerase [Erysiphe lesion-associated ormycovirus 2]
MGGISPLVGGNVYREHLDDTHDAHIADAGKWLRGFSYNELFKYKERLNKELGCKPCINSLLSLVGYLKFHLLEHPHALPLCKLIMTSYLTLEGQEEYDLYPEIRSKIYECKVLKKPIPEDLINNPLYVCENKCISNSGAKLRTRDFPSLNAFPLWKLNKESKMPLTQLPVPGRDNIENLEKILYAFITKYGPKQVTIPASEAVMSLSPNLYSDGHILKRDYEKPSNTWMYSFTYQRFLTNPLTEREVWVPPKAYKMCSSWWHFITEPIAKEVPYVICNDTITEVRKNLHKRFTPCTKLDLKGFGLQFPREYVMAFINVFCKIYPSKEAEEYKNLASKLFEIISIKMDDGTFIKPLRGVGLGYFTNIMTLVVAALLENYNVCMMFSDDILIDRAQYMNARYLLESFNFVINDEKSGREWDKTPFFAGCCMAPNGSLRFAEAQGPKAALHTMRYHWQRKNSFLSQNWDMPWKMAYHYERIFGFEIRRGESLDHPVMLGLNQYAAKPIGYVKGGLLRNYRAPKPEGNESQRRLWAMSFPWKEKVQKKEFQIVRNNLKKEINRIHYTEYDEYLKPEIKLNTELLSIKPDFFLGKYQLPRWADLQSLVAVGRTCGRITRGIHPKKAAHEMLNYLLADDPINAWLSGGYEIVSPFYRMPYLDPDIQLIYERLRRAIRFSHPVAYKVTDDITTQSTIKDGDGISFLKSINLEEGPIDDITIEDRLLEDVFSVRSEHESDIEFNELDEDDFSVQFGDEDDSHSLSGDSEINFDF